MGHRNDVDSDKYHSGICCVDYVLPAISRLYSDRFLPRVTVLLRTRLALAEYFPTPEKRVDLADWPDCRRGLLQDLENPVAIVGLEQLEAPCCFPRH